MKTIVQVYMTTIKHCLRRETGANKKYGFIISWYINIYIYIQTESKAIEKRFPQCLTYRPTFVLTIFLKSGQTDRRQAIIQQYCCRSPFPIYWLRSQETTLSQREKTLHSWNFLSFGATGLTWPRIMNKNRTRKIFDLRCSPTKFAVYSPYSLWACVFKNLSMMIIMIAASPDKCIYCNEYGNCHHYSQSSNI